MTVQQCAVLLFHIICRQLQIISKIKIVIFLHPTTPLNTPVLEPHPRLTTSHILGLLVICKERPPNRPKGLEIGWPTIFGLGLARIPLGELTALPRPPSWWEGACPSQKIPPHPALGLSGIDISPRCFPAPPVSVSFCFLKKYDCSKISSTDFCPIKTPTLPEFFILFCERCSVQSVVCAVFCRVEFLRTFKSCYDTCRLRFTVCCWPH